MQGGPFSYWKQALVTRGTADLARHSNGHRDGGLYTPGGAVNRSWAYVESLRDLEDTKSFEFTSILQFEVPALAAVGPIPGGVVELTLGERAAKACA